MWHPLITLVNTTSKIQRLIIKSEHLWVCTKMLSLHPRGSSQNFPKVREREYVVSCKRGHFSKNEFWFSDLPNPSNKVNRCRRAASTQFAMTYFQYEEYCKIWSKYHRGTWTENNSNQKSLFFISYQVLGSPLHGLLRCSACAWGFGLNWGC